MSNPIIKVSLAMMVMLAVFGLYTVAIINAQSPGAASVPLPSLTPTPTPVPLGYLESLIVPANASDARTFGTANQTLLQAYNDAANASTPDLRDPSYEELLSFLVFNDTTQAAEYNDTYMCGAFAAALKNHSESMGIRGYYVGISFWDRPDGHIINAWHTTDRGWICVDACGFDEDVTASGNWSFKAEVYPVAGQTYLKMVPSGITNYPARGFGWGKIREVDLFRDVNGESIQLSRHGPYSFG